MVNQIASGTGSQEQGKKSGDEGLQKLGQGSQAPSFSDLDQYIGKEFQSEFQGFNLTEVKFQEDKPIQLFQVDKEFWNNSEPAESGATYSDVMYLHEIFEKHMELAVNVKTVLNDEVIDFAKTPPPLTSKPKDGIIEVITFDGGNVNFNYYKLPEVSGFRMARKV